MSEAVCFKCRVSAASIISRDGKRKCYCIQCFKLYTFNIFRSSVQKHAFLEGKSPSGSIVVAASGGRSSMLLLQWLCDLRDYQESNGYVKWGNIFAVHVEGLSDEADRKGKDRFRFLATFCTSRNVLLRTVSLHDDINISLFPKEVIRAHRLLFLRTALVHYAKRHHVPCVFVGGDAGALSSLTLYYLACGGGHLYWKISAEKECVSGISIFRPLRSLLATETALTAHYHRIQYFARRSKSQKKLGDVNSAIFDFMTNISEQFKSAIFNVLRTVDKVSSQMDSEDSATELDSLPTCFVCVKKIREASNKDSVHTLCSQCHRLLVS